LVIFGRVTVGIVVDVCEPAGGGGMVTLLGEGRPGGAALGGAGMTRDVDPCVAGGAKPIVTHHGGVRYAQQQLQLHSLMRLIPS